MWHRLYYHLVWTTKLRGPTLDADAARFLCRYLRAVSARYRCRILEIGMVRSHVHILVAGHPQTDFPKLVGHLKGGSATVWNKDYAVGSGWELRWAPGYGLSTVGRRQIEFLEPLPEAKSRDQIFEECQ